MTKLPDAPEERNAARDDFFDRLGFIPNPNAKPSERNPIRALRRHCLECSGSPRLVEECPSSNCALFPFRLGVNPFRRVAGSSDDDPATLDDHTASAGG